MNAPAPKIFKKGELLFREGDKLTSVFIVQSGGVNLCIQRPKKNIDLIQVGTNQVLGEIGLGGGSSYTYSAVATTETKVLELPVEQARALVEGGTQAFKIIVKSMADRLKQVMSELRGIRMEKDGVPCPDEQLSGIFAGVFHTLNHKGEKDPKDPRTVQMDWTLLKAYSQRMFGVTPKRTEQVLNILVKFKNATLTMGKAPDNPDGPDEIQKVQVTDTSYLEGFFEYWQYHYFKNGRTDMLRFDESLLSYVQSLIKLGETLTPDRFGVVQIELGKAMEHVKNEIGMNLTPDHFSRLEQRGVFAKRAPKTDGVVWLQWEMKEFQHVARNWKFIREVDKWNEKGYVDLHEEQTAAKKKNPGEISCPQCSSGVPQAAKFCPECGLKLAADKAS